MTNNQLIQQIKQSIVHFDPMAKVILYGSRARGTATKESDWDILVVSENKDKRKEIEKKISEKLYLIELHSGELINTLFYTKDEWHSKYSITPLYENIRKEGIEL